jgi:tetratricopeptide (TPR) repeat protein
MMHRLIPIAGPALALLAGLSAGLPAAGDERFGGSASERTLAAAVALADERTAVLAEAEQLAAAGDGNAALDALEVWLGAHPDDIIAGNAYRGIATEANLYDRPIRFLVGQLKALTPCPDEPPICPEDKPDCAKEVYDRCTEGAPGAPAGLRYNLAFAYIDKIPVVGPMGAGFLSKRSIEQFRTALEADGEDWIANYGVGMNYLHWPDYFEKNDSSVAYFERAIEIQEARAARPSDILAYVRLGDALAKAGDAEGAQAAWQRGADRLGAHADLSERLEIDPAKLKETVTEAYNPNNSIGAIDTDISILWAEETPEQVFSLRNPNGPVVVGGVGGQTLPERGDYAEARLFNWFRDNLPLLMNRQNADKVDMSGIGATSGEGAGLIAYNMIQGFMTQFRGDDDATVIAALAAAPPYERPFFHEGLGMGLGAALDTSADGSLAPFAGRIEAFDPRFDRLHYAGLGMWYGLAPTVNLVRVRDRLAGLDLRGQFYAYEGLGFAVALFKDAAIAGRRAGAAAAVRDRLDLRPWRRTRALDQARRRPCAGRRYRRGLPGAVPGRPARRLRHGRRIHPHRPHRCHPAPGRTLSCRVPDRLHGLSDRRRDGARDPLRDRSRLCPRGDAGRQQRGDPRAGTGPAPGRARWPRRGAADRRRDAPQLARRHPHPAGRRPIRRPVRSHLQGVRPMTSIATRAAALLGGLALALPGAAGDYAFQLHGGHFYGPGPVVPDTPLPDGLIQGIQFDLDQLAGVAVYAPSADTLSDGETHTNANIQAGELSIGGDSDHKAFWLYAVAGGPNEGRETYRFDDDHNMVWTVDLALDPGFPEGIVRVDNFTLTTGQRTVPQSLQTEQGMPGGYDKAGSLESGTVLVGRVGDFDADGFLDGVIVASANVPMQADLLPGAPVGNVRGFKQRHPRRAAVRAGADAGRHRQPAPAGGAVPDRRPDRYADRASDRRQRSPARRPRQLRGRLSRRPHRGARRTAGAGLAAGIDPADDLHPARLPDHLRLPRRQRLELNRRCRDPRLRQGRGTGGPAGGAPHRRRALTTCRCLLPRPLGLVQQGAI